MPTKRGEEIPRLRPWTVRAVDLAAGKGWDHLVDQFPDAADHAWVAITSDPYRREERQHPLRGTLAWASVGGKRLEQWEFEVTSGARLRYAVDPATRTLWITHAGVGHPKDTDKPRRKKRG